MDDDTKMTNGHTTSDNITSLLLNSMPCNNTNFDSSVKGDQLRLDLMYRWMRCRCNSGGRPDISLQWFEKLCQYHCEAQRHYHTLMHLEEMFLYLDLMLSNKNVTVLKKSSTSQQEESLVLATFFHDAIYNVHSASNEEDSAVLFQQFIKEVDAGGAVIAEGFEETVVQMILATKKHQVSEENTPLLALFLDMDMAVLGKEAKAYDRYAKLIRKEYQHVPHATYCEKRADILEEFLKQSQIYGTETMLVTLEQRARDNIGREIETLRRGEIPGSRSNTT